MPIQTEERRVVRTVSEVMGVPRWGFRSLWRSAKEEVAVHRAAGREAPAGEAVRGLEPKLVTGPKPAMRERAAFLTAAVAKWASEYVTHMFKRTRTLPKYPAGDTGRYRMPDTVTIGLAADWGTGTDSAYAVAREIAGRDPHITIHMGDVYYSGTAKEYSNYLLAPGCWPRGSLPTPGENGEAAGTWVLNGNHEMYSSGEGYFDVALPLLKQTSSYFCLENAHWRIVALDTGYHCSRGIKKLFGDTTRLPDATVDWLKGIMDPGDERPVILLSHHQWFSAFEKGYATLGRQLLPHLGRVHLWFWGHEHKLAGYEAYAPEGKTPVRARCIGHGGMPIELGWSPKKQFPAPLVFSDQRVCARNCDQVRGAFARHDSADAKPDSQLGYCGFAVLRLDGGSLTVTYVDEDGTELLEEEWTNAGGTLAGSARVLVNEQAFKLYRDISRLAK
ncbi:MAG TPA: metallophosphoesterase [Longimicrobiaceae bacterium]|nr:metallophosphoesterase [Longimicrobiaceae bacterium]